MACSVTTFLQAIVDAYNSKVSECECDNSFLPSNKSNLCGDGDGLVKEIIDGTDALISDCELFENPSYPRPELEDCALSSDFLQALLDWISHLYCVLPECLETVTANYTFSYTLDARFQTSISAIDPQQIIAGVVAGGDNYNVQWFENEELFGAGKYTLTLNEKNTFSLQLRSYLENFLLYSGTDVSLAKPCKTIQITDAMRVTSPIIGNITSVKVETVLVLEDCDGNRTVTSIHDSLVGSSCGDNAISFELFSPTKIGMSVRHTVTTTGESPVGFVKLYMSDFGGEYALSPCPNECFPQKVVSLEYNYIGGGTGSLSWTDQDCCWDLHKIYWKKVDDCDECELQTSLTFQANTAGSPYNMPALEVGLYCIRVDTVKGDFTAYGTPICVDIACVPENDVVLNSTTPTNGQQIFLTTYNLSSYTFAYSVNASYVSKIGISIVPSTTLVDSTVVDVIVSGLDPSGDSSISGNCTVSKGFGAGSIYTTYFLRVTLYDECDNAYPQEDRTFRIVFSPAGPQWSTLSGCYYAADSTGSTYCANLTSYPGYYILRWVTDTGADVTFRRGDLYCAVAPGSQSYCVKLQGLR